MHINPKDTLAGVPVVAIRDFLRAILTAPMPDEGWASDDLARRYGRPGFPALQAELVTAGYLQNVGGHHDAITPAGCQFALASAARPMKRATAEKALRDFLARVQEINQNPHYLYRVDMLVVFGSYLRQE